MPQPNLAFLQNFYTDVTLYMPAEPARQAVAHPVETANAPAAPEPAPVTPSVLPPVAKAAPVTTASVAPLASVAAAPLLTPEPKPAPVPPPVQQPAAPTRSGGPGNQTPAAPAVPPVMLVTFSTQGSRADGVVLLVRMPHEQFLKLPRNVFLNKMLQALGLVMADVVLVNVESHLPVALANLRRELAAKQIIAFGKNLLDTTIRNTQIYEPVLFASMGLSYLASAEIELLEYDVSLKKRLWAGLQRMFLS